MQHVRCGAFDVSETAEQRLKNIALVFGLLSAATMVFDFYLYMKDLCVTTGFPELSGACMVFAVFRGCFHGPIFA